jgi:hypothetical protein
MSMPIYNYTILSHSSVNLYYLYSISWKVAGSILDAVIEMFPFTQFLSAVL